MGYFQVRYNSRVVIYERKMFIRFTTVAVVGTTVGTYDTHLYPIAGGYINSIWPCMQCDQIKIAKCL